MAATAAEGEQLGVRVLGQDFAERVGAKGFVFALDSESFDGGSLPVELEIDYSGFANAYGGDYAHRLQVVSLPACALGADPPAGCDRRGTPLPSTNLGGDERLVVDVADLGTLASEPASIDDGVMEELAAIAASAPDGQPDVDAEAAAPELEGWDAPAALDPWASSDAAFDPQPGNGDGVDAEGAADVDGPGSSVVLALMSDVGGELGTYAATPSSMTGQWSVTPGSGEFNYSYPFDVPAPGAGSAPEVALSYSSGSVDGLTNARNAQGSMNGIGWSDFTNASIEKHFQPCYMYGAAPVLAGMSDFCFEGYDRMTISLGGVSGTMVPVDSQNREFRLKNDPGWRIQRIGDVSSAGDSQRWIVTGPDGTKYHFGVYSEPDSGEATWSRLWVPVLGDEPGEPCWNAAENKVGSCNMTYRWMLDRVVDPDLNVTAYFYDREANRYDFLAGAGALSGGSPSRPYYRSAALARIDYGRRNGSTAPPAGRVHFGVQARCKYLDARFRDTNGNGTPDVDGSDCERATSANGSLFFDVPNDMVCSTTSWCGHVTPSFFTDRRYSHVFTEVWADSEWKPVTQTNLTHSIGIIGSNKMYLTRLQHAAVSQGGLAAYPETIIDHDGAPDNRVDHDPDDEATRMRHYRITSIQNPFGGTVAVTYGQQRPCSTTYTTDRWDQNFRDCFPQSIRDADSSFPLTGVFHKWLVRSVVETPRFGGGQPGNDAMTTTYFYGDDPEFCANERRRFGCPSGTDGGPGWAYDYGAFARGDWDRGWSSWRGYETTTITRGPSVTKVRIHRGLHGDASVAFVNGQRTLDIDGRTENITSFDEVTYSTLDATWLAGRALEEAAMSEPLEPSPGDPSSGQDSIPLTSTLYKYEVKQYPFVPQDTGTIPAEREHDRPRWVGVSETVETNGRYTTYDETLGWQRESRQRGALMTYNGHFQPETTVERGWLDDLDDDRCSITTYADNRAAWMLNYPQTNTVRAGATCDGDDQILSYSETYYDQLTTLGAPPVRGNVTKVRTQVDGTRFAETTSEYDTVGRPKTVVGPSGAITTTAYTPAESALIPAQTIVTNRGADPAPAATADDQVVTTDFLPEFSAPTRVVDPHGEVTSYRYDTFGRTEAVRSPTEQSTGDSRTAEFAYLVDFDGSDSDSLPEAPPMVRSRLLQNDTGSSPVFEDSWVVYDGMMRQRQAQAPSPESGKVLVSTTTYDSRGQVYDEIAPEAVTGTIGTGLLVPASGAPWKNRTRYSYDEVGREITSTWLVDAVASHSTSTSYDLVSVETEGPDGMTVRNTTDGHGRTVMVEEKDGANWVASNYAYDLAGNLTQVTDPAGNQTAFTYDMAGRKLTQTDPDRGAAEFAYDAAGNPAVAEDASGQQIHTTYDILGRPEQRWADAPITGDLLASWSYDTVKVGLPTSSTRHTTAGDWVSAVTAYDQHDRATASALTVPAGIPGLSGTYEVDQSYDRAGRPVSASYPAAGGLPAETVTVAYNGFGLPATLTGADDYVWATGYDARTRPAVTIVGPQNPANGFNIGMAHYREHNGDGLLSGTSTFLESSTLPDKLVAERGLTYRDDGQIVATDRSLGGQTWRECNDYDDRARLTSVFTVDRSSECTTANSGGGSQPFERSYTYSPDGKLTQRIDDGATTDYAYPTAGPGAVRPHAPLTVGSQTYTWNPDGSLGSRTVDGGIETFTWDIENLLQSVAGPDGTTEFVYDASGSRLLRTTAAGSTLYLAGQEVTANAAGTQVSAVRSYSYNGQLVATRTATGVDYVMSDGAGSVEASIPAGGSALEDARRYDPYGQVRSEVGDGFDSDRGFLGQIEDDTTGLSYLNARYYDTQAAIFISTDPLFDATQPKSLNPYQYGFNNPATFADPSGLMSSQTWGLGYENSQLRGHITHLEGVIKQMDADIQTLQGIIRERDRVINEMLTYIEALNAVIRQQDAVIRNLNARVQVLTRQVNYWRGQAYYWRGQAMYWRGQAVYWQGQATYWKGQATYWKGEAMKYQTVLRFYTSKKHGVLGGMMVMDMIARGTWTPSILLGRRYSAEEERTIAAVFSMNLWPEPQEDYEWPDYSYGPGDFLDDISDRTKRSVGVALKGVSAISNGINNKVPNLSWPGMSPIFIVNCEKSPALCPEQEEEFPAS